MELLRRVIPIAVTVALVIVAAIYVRLGVRQPWDFETYYTAGAALRTGLNPYSADVLSSMSGGRVELPFLYPPSTLLMFAPMSALPFRLALGLWLGLNVALLGFLLWLWRREFVPRTSIPVLVITALLGFNLATLWDLRTGNVALVEAFVLWLAFAAYTRNRIGLTAVSIAAGSVFKLLPIFLITIVLMAHRPWRMRMAWVAAALALLLVLVSIPPALSSAWIHGFTQSPEVARPTGEINPSALGLADGLTMALELPAEAAPVIALILYLLYAAVILIASIGTWFRSRESSSPMEPIVFVTLLWLLLSPRVMVYSYVMAIVPTLYVIETRIRSSTARWAALALVVAQGIVRLLPGQPPAALAPLSFAILMGVWLLFRSRALPPGAVRSPSPTPG